MVDAVRSMLTAFGKSATIGENDYSPLITHLTGLQSKTEEASVAEPVTGAPPFCSSGTRQSASVTNRLRRTPRKSVAS